MSNDQKHIEYLDLITKKLSEEISSDEDQKLQIWLNEDPENQAVYDTYLATWNEMDKVKGMTSKDVDVEWSRIENAINFDEDETGEKERSIFPNAYKFAATFLLLAVFIFSVYYFVSNQPTEQLVAQAEIQEVELPEGSVVTVNSNSTLS